MNKKGMIVTYLPFKKYLIVGAILLGLYLLYYFFIMRSTGIISIKTSCPEGIIPSRILMDKEGEQLLCHMERNQGGYRWGNCINTWEDGTTIGMGSFTCYKGYKEGQNINYFYCDDTSYSNTPVDSNGNIGKEIEFKISFVIDPNDSTEKGYKIIDYSCRT